MSDEDLVLVRDTFVEVQLEMTSMITIAVWHGTHQESLELVNAVAANCTCEFGDMGEHLTVCEAHTMLATDQRALDGLLFVRQMADRLRHEEFSLVGVATLGEVVGASRDSSNERADRVTRRGVC